MIKCLKKLFILRTSHPIDGVLHSDPKPKYLIWKLNNVKSKPFGIVATEDVPMKAKDCGRHALRFFFSFTGHLI